MRLARVAYAGAIHVAQPVRQTGRSASPDLLRLGDGRIVGESDVVWLPPVEPGNIIALGLNYADHVKELAKELSTPKQSEPLAFLKSPGSLIGHRGLTHRPDAVKFMHYECELAVVIGVEAYQVSRESAMEHVAGYSIANDYAIRDYLENYLRPNLKVKNRNGGTVLGPWLVSADEVPNPHALALRCLVNGELRQQGNTSDLIFDIPFLIEYLSGFMTLNPGDVILTGTPEGVSNVVAGDEVVCEIEGLGRLVNTIGSDAQFGLEKKE
jgi:5-oxopent-3-ene-1,2,5-tricarboxylate decarboxylase / 2-hydroxyhepta-2,4-diene-1,7-dioate isomerase